MRINKKALGVVLVMSFCIALLSACTETSDDAYETFLEGNNTLSFSYYIDNVYVDKEYKSSLDEAMLKLGSDDTEYTISEIKDALNKYIEKGIGSMEYAYIDCGVDGVKEMVLRIEMPSVHPGAKYFWVIKEIESRLQVIYAFEEFGEGYRDHVSINKFGYIEIEYRDATSVLSHHSSYIDADGKYEDGYGLSYNRSFEGFAGEMEEKGYLDRNLDGEIYWYGLHLEPNNSGNTQENYISYEVYDEETKEKMDIPNLYTDSKYKKVMDYFNDVCGDKIITMDELNQKIEDKLDSIGLTEQIMNGEEAEYKELNID
ncbi:MAG: hypothetical protein IKS48_04840 [Eubacterium sp.]|nr:hypothetical protein [Eubacterium sp.]